MCFSIFSPKWISPAVRQALTLTNFTNNNKVVKRLMSSRSPDCKQEVGPKCSPENLAKTACAAQKKLEKEGKAEPKPVGWENPECCVQRCPDADPRFDELYYRQTDKLTANYTRTWIECPDLKIVPKKICGTEKLLLPPIVRRKRLPKSARKPDDCKYRKLEGTPNCPKLRMSGCRKQKINKSCRASKPVSKCKKVCAPYPSFSECLRIKSKRRRYTECTCAPTLPGCAVLHDMKL